MATYNNAYVGCTRPAKGMTTGLRNIITAMNECQVPGIRYPLASGFNVRNIAGTNTLSLHACGRAHDVMIKNIAGGTVIANALAKAGASLGIQEIIFNHRRWTQARGWYKFTGPNPHTDHVHWSISPSATGISLSEARSIIRPLLCDGNGYLPDPSTGQVSSGNTPAGVASDPPPPTFADFTGTPNSPTGTFSLTLSPSVCGAAVVTGRAYSTNRMTTYLPVRIYVNGKVVQIVKANRSDSSTTNMYEATLYNLKPGNSYTVRAFVDGSSLGYGLVYLGQTTVSPPPCTAKNVLVFGTPPAVYATVPEHLDEQTAYDLLHCDTDRLGCDDYSVCILNRGGLSRFCCPNQVLGLQFNRVLDDVSQARVVFSGGTCPTCMSDVNPWEHELAIFRGNEQVWVGPIHSIDYNVSQNTVDVFAYDLASWFDVRLIPHSPEGYYAECADLTTIFEDVVHDAMLPDPRINISTFGLPTEIRGSREYDPDQFRVAGDELRELARSGVDFTMVNRYLFVSSVERVTNDSIPLIIDEHWVSPPSIKVDGSTMVTRAVVGGSSSGSAGYDEVGIFPGPPGGTGTADDAMYSEPAQRFGLVERLYDETSIEDECSDDYEQSIDMAARTRWDLQNKPYAYIEGGQLSESAPLSFDCLVPGRRIQVQITGAIGGRTVQDTYRIQEITVTYNGREQVNVTLTPVGTESVETFTPSPTP